MSNRRLNLSLPLALLVSLLSGSALAGPPEGYPYLSYDEGMRQAQEQKKHVFIYFGREGCGWCRKMNTEVFIKAELKKRLTENYILIYVDTESGARMTLPSGERVTEMEFASRQKAFGTPVFLFTESSGKPIHQAVGLNTKDDLLSMDAYVHGGKYRTLSYEQFREKR